MTTTVNFCILSTDIRTKRHQRHRRLRGGYCQMFNPFSTGCLSQCKCQKQRYRAVFGLCTNTNFGIEKQSGRKQRHWRQQEGRTQKWDNKQLQSEPKKHPKNSSKETKNWTSEQSERSRIKLKNNTEWRPSFFLHFNQPQKQVNEQN